MLFATLGMQTIYAAEGAKTITPVEQIEEQKILPITELTEADKAYRVQTQRTSNDGEGFTAKKAFAYVSVPFVIVGGIIYYAVGTVILLPVYIVKKATGQKI